MPFRYLGPYQSVLSGVTPSANALPLQEKQNTMESKEIRIVYRKIGELVEPDYNPRKISAKQREDIRRSLEGFGFVQPLVVNTNPGRKNIVIGGNQRLKIAKSMGYEEAPCVEVDLDEERERELNLRLNKNQAEFDMKLLNDFFEKEVLFKVGFTEKEVGKLESEFDEKFKAITNDNCEMPIVPKFSEKYGCVIIIFDSELDENWLRNVLSLERAKDYKNERMGTPYVVTAAKFQEIWEKATTPINY